MIVNLVKTCSLIYIFCFLVSDVDMPYLCSTAVVEAKKWLQERKLGSNSELDLDDATPSVNPSWSPHVGHPFIQFFFFQIEYLHVLSFSVW